MSPAAKHVTDEELLALMDGEAERPGTVLGHLAVCAACRKRQELLAGASEAAAQLYKSGWKLPEAEAGRLRLQLAMEAANAGPRRLLPRWGYAVAAMLLAGAAVALVVHRGAEPVQAAEIVPNGRLTPGMVRTVELGEICGAGVGGDLDPTVTPEVRAAVLREYGLDGARAEDYQIDYLINPQLGGTADVRNLWPEPYRATAWNARAKDALEGRLHEMVCRREIGLDEAQRAIAGDWIAAYKRYFHVERPVS